MKLKMLVVLIISFAINSYAQNQISIVPKPVKLEVGKGNFVFNEKTKIWIDPGTEMEKLGDLLASTINSQSGLKLTPTWKMTKDIPKSLVRIEFKDDIKSDEGYIITTKPNLLKITAKKGAGIFYALQSIFQLLPVKLNKKNVSIPCVNIQDEPRFQWRGTHLDVCRHFFPVEFVKKYIDVLAMYKLNSFHWHLTDDQGWRIEIKKYPKLTEISSLRKEQDGSIYGGFYTQEQIKDVVKYASERYINVVPEIEMPGHSVAALSAYPQFSCTGGPFEVANYWGITPDIYCAGNDDTFKFIEDVLTEVMNLFPSKIIHIGGDEAPKDRWKECAKCQIRMNAEKLKNEHELQSYFVQRVEKFVNSKGRKIIGWDEILEGGLAPNAAVMSWRGIDGGIAAAKAKHYAVMSPGTHCYFDHYQGLNNEPKAIGGYTTLEKVYSYEPVPDALTQEEAKYILGAQANVWTEYILSSDHVEYMLLPRLLALSEVVWSPKELRNYNDFSLRMNKQYDILASKNYNFRVPNPFPDVTEILKSPNEKIKFNKPVVNSKIFYTTDGSEPSSSSLVYKEPISISTNSTLKAITVLDNGKSSQINSINVSIIDSLTNGLNYKYYEGFWEMMPEFSSLTPKSHGKIYKVSLREIKNQSESFAFTLNGFINIEKEGTYTFYLASDDGSKLFINNQIVVDNDGNHGTIEKSGQINLAPGKIPFDLQYFNKWGSMNLILEYEGPGFSRTPVPASAIFVN